MPAVTPRPSTAEVRELFARYAEHGDPRDLDTLFRFFAPLARRLARQYNVDGDRSEDLEQVANLGLLKALKRFDPDRGFAFSSFAVPTILGEIKRSFRDSAWAAHVPRRVQERSAEVRTAHRRLETTLRRSPTVREIAEAIGSDEEEVLDALRALETKRSLSLDAPAREEDDAVLGDGFGTADPGYDKVVDVEAIRSALPVLTDMQRQVLELRFAGDLKQSDIAARLGVSQMQISRVLSTGLERLRIVVEHQSRPHSQAA